MSVSSDPLLGSELLGYRVEDLLGRGGMGVVYRAYDPRLKRRVALKLLAPELSQDERFRSRFLAETELAASLEHPNVVPVHDAGEVEGQLYLVMRFVEGSDLKRHLREQGRLSPERAIAVCSQVATALDAAHGRGLVHRDVKPSNVLLDVSGHAYLADFGLTRRLAEQAPGFDAGLSLGTPAYVAPEQIEGAEVDGRADQYSLACVLVECLRDEPPFPRPSEAAVLFAHLEEEPPMLPGLDDVVRRGLAKAPDARYETCTELVEQAREALVGNAVGVARAQRRRRRRLLVLTPLTVLATAAVAVGGVLVARDADTPTTISQDAIAGARLGVTHGEFPEDWGTPGAILSLQEPPDHSKQVWDARKVAVYYDSAIVGAIQNGTVGAVEITTWNKNDRTGAGVGPCSTVDELKAAYGARLKPVEANIQKGLVFGYTVGRKLFFAVAANRTPPRVSAVALYSSPLEFAGFNALNDGPCA